MNVLIRAMSVYMVEDGVYCLEIASPSLSPEEIELLGRLFPRLAGSVYRLLDQEQLLNCVLQLPPAPVKKTK